MWFGPNCAVRSAFAKASCMRQIALIGFECDQGFDDISPASTVSSACFKQFERPSKGNACLLVAPEGRQHDSDVVVVHS